MPDQLKSMTPPAPFVKHEVNLKWLGDTHRIPWAPAERAAARQPVAFRCLYLCFLLHRMTVLFHHPWPLHIRGRSQNKQAKTKEKEKKKRKERKTSGPHAVTDCACCVRRQEKAWEKWCTDLRYEKQEGRSVKLRPWAPWIYSGVFPFLPSSQWVWWDNKYLCDTAKIIVVRSLGKVFYECVSFETQ